MLKSGFYSTDHQFLIYKFKILHTDKLKFTRNQKLEEAAKVEVIEVHVLTYKRGLGVEGV
jgi:hypothetical protein